MEARNEIELFKNALKLPLVYLAVIWSIFLLQNLTGFRPGTLGVLPRDTWGLWGILFSPLLHGSLGHIVSNSIPFLVLSTSIFYFYEKVAFRSFIMIYILGGIALWLLGNLFFCGTEFNRSCHLPHIGASGVVYGLLAFVFWNGIFRKSLQSIVLALVVTVMYSGYFAGIVPNQETNVSWEGHLFGAISGIFAAYFYREELEASEVDSLKDIYANENTQKNIDFLPADTFEKTKEQRLRDQRNDRDDFWTSDIT